jgi:hypothetical protein
MRFMKALTALSAILALSCGLLDAQTGWKKKKDDDGTRVVEGIVTDTADTSVKGAVVQLKDTKTLQIRSFFTPADGKYRFTGLSGSVDYEVKATFQSASSSTKRVSLYDTRKDVILNLKLDK